jgi:hypothetical protein
LELANGRIAFHKRERERGSNMKRVLVLLVVVALVLAVMVLGAGAAFAGEVKGPPGATPDFEFEFDTAAVTHANSDCAYSGLNDVGPPQVQSYGQLVAAGFVVPSEDGAAPGVACHGGSNPNRGGRP